MNANSRGWLSLIRKKAATPPAIPQPAGGSVAPPAAMRVAAIADTGTVPPPPFEPPGEAAAENFRREAPLPCILLAVDATASRSHAWEAAKAVTDRLFTAVPGKLEVALAAHGGGSVHTFTPFTQDVNVLRDIAAGVTCLSGRTNLLGILDRALAEKRVRVVVYIGDVYEESHSGLKRRAEALLLNETRVIVLHDDPHGVNDAKPFQAIAALTGGAVLPFDASAVDELAAMLEAVSVLAVGGTELLAEKQATLPAAPLLLERLEANRPLRITGRT